MDPSSSFSFGSNSYECDLKVLTLPQRTSCHTILRERDMFFKGVLSYCTVLLLNCNFTQKWLPLIFCFFPTLGSRHSCTIARWCAFGGFDALKKPARSGRGHENGEGTPEHSRVQRGFSLSRLLLFLLQSCVCVWIRLWVTAAVYRTPLNTWHLR